MRIVLKVLAGLVALLLATIIIAPFFLNLNNYKPKIEALALEALGRQLIIEGDIKAGILPSSHLSVENIKLANDPQSQNITMLSAKKISIAVELLPLLKKQINITSVSLIEPVIELEEYADKTNNWQFITKLSKSSAEDESQAEATIKSKPAININNISIQNATLGYKKPFNPAKHFEKINLEVNGDLMSGPLKTDLSLELNNEKLSVELSMPKIDFNSPMPFTADGKFGGHTIHYTGTFDLATTSLQGSLKGELEKINDTFEKTAFSGTLNVDQNYIDLRDMVFTCGKTQGSGFVKFGLKGQTINADLQGLPGSSHLAINTALSEQEHYAGTLVLRSKNLKVLCDTLKIETPAIVTKLGKNIDLKTDFTFNGPQDIGVKRLNLNLNGAEVFGEATKKGDLITLNLNTPKTAAMTQLFDLKFDELGAVQLVGTLSGDGQKMDFNLHTKIKNGTFKAQGLVNNLSSSPTFDIQTDIQDPDINRLVRILKGSPLPIGGHDFHFLGHIQGDSEHIKITKMSGRITPKSQAINFSGDMDINLKNPKKDIKLNLALDNVGISDMMADNSQRLQFMLASQKNRIASEFKGWSTEPLDLSFLHSFDLDGKITANSMRFKDYRFNQVSIPITINNGVLDTPIKAQMAGGSLSCHLNITANNKLDIALTLKDAQLDQLVSAQSKVHGGQINIDLKATGNGNSQQQIVNSLNGAFSLNTSGTMIKGFDKNNLFEGIGNANNLQGLLGLFNKKQSKNEAPSINMTIKTDINNGIAVIKEGIVKGGGIDGVVSGNINLPQYKVDIHTVVKLDAIKNGAIEVNTYGPIDNPQTDIDKSKLASQLMELSKEFQKDGKNNIAENLLGQVLGKDKKSDEPKSHKTEAAEAISGLLGNLFKK